MCTSWAELAEQNKTALTKSQSRPRPRNVSADRGGGRKTIGGTVAAVYRTGGWEVGGHYTIHLASSELQHQNIFERAMMMKREDPRHGQEISAVLV
jgi:hypothetical protein